MRACKPIPCVFGASVSCGRAEGHRGYMCYRHMHAHTYISEADSRKDGQHEVERHRVLEFEADLTCEAVPKAVAHASVYTNTSKTP